MVGGLWTYKKSYDFIATTIVEDGVKYEEALNLFDKDFIEFYINSDELFLVDHNRKEGGNKTPYMYIFKFYVPILARRAWNDLNVCVGVVNTQGVEAKKKVSKTT